MEAGPHPLIERIVGALCPPVARESVLGDLAERYRSPGQYLAEACAALPLVVFGQIRRTTTFAAFGLQTLILFGCMGGFALSQLPRDIPMWARAAIPTAVAMGVLVLRDAYRTADGWSAGRALRDITAITAAVALCQLFAMALVGAGLISSQWVFAPKTVVVMALSILPALFVFRLGLGLDGDSRLQEPLGALSAAELRSDYGRFRTRVRTRNLLEVSIFGLGAVSAALFLIVAPGPERFLEWCWPAGQIIVSWYLLTGASARPIPDQAPFATLVAFYAGEIARQRRHVRVIWWWYLWPLCIGVGLPALARASESPIFAILGLGSIALVVGFVAWFARNRARDFQEEMDILSAVEERA